MSRITRDEADLIILSDESIIIKIPISLAIFAFGGFFLWGAITLSDTRLFGIPVKSPNVSWGKLLLTFFGGFISMYGLYGLLIDKSIIIDKKIQTVIIKRKSIIEALNSISKIPFSDIKKIEIENQISDFGNRWDIDLITIKGKSTHVYTAKDEIDADTAAEKIGKIITDKEISYATYDTTIE